MDNLIEFQDVTFEYPEKTFALKNITFTISTGKKYVICGQNGAGKTTLIRLLLGLETPQSGIIKIRDLIMNRKTIKDIRKEIGYVFQNPDSQVFSASVFEDVAFGLRNQGKPKDEIEQLVDQALNYVDMIDYKDRSPYQLSFGQKKRIAIAGVLAMDPSIIVMDEPFSNLDYPSKVKLQEILENNVINRGKTVIFAEHNRKLIHEWGNYALFLDKGQLIYFDDVKGLINLPQTEKYLGPL
ncbi:MAG: ABC transporter ATP-binding protein [Asgard group archaeon]|nr:ABC transporter ATP-binding protein [Asgard group archaeon]